MSDRYVGRQSDALVDFGDVARRDTGKPHDLLHRIPAFANLPGIPDAEEKNASASFDAMQPGQVLGQLSSGHLEHAISQTASQSSNARPGGASLTTVDTGARAYLRKHFQSTMSRFLSTYSSHLPIPNSSVASNASLLTSVCR